MAVKIAFRPARGRIIPLESVQRTSLFVFPAGTYWMRVHHGVAVEPLE